MRFQLTLFQLAIRGEISESPSPSTIMQDSPMYLSVALQYGRSKQSLYVRDTLMAIINDVANQEDLDLVTDPCIVRQLVSIPNRSDSICRRFIARGSTQKKCDQV